MSDGFENHPHVRTLDSTTARPLDRLQVDEVALLNNQSVLGEDLRITMTTIVVVVVAIVAMNASMIDIKHTLRFSMKMLW